MFDFTIYLDALAKFNLKQININRFNKIYYEDRYFAFYDYLKRKYKLTGPKITLDKLSIEDRNWYITIIRGFERYKSRKVMLTLVHSLPMSKEEKAKLRRSNILAQRKIDNDMIIKQIKMKG